MVLALAALLAAPARALAVPTVDGEFSVSEMPSHLALGPDGNIWVTLSGGGNKLAKVTPAGAVTEYNAPNISGSPVGIVAGPDGAMWVTDTGHVAKFTTANPNGAVETAVADITDARGIVVGPDNNLWTASVDQLVKIPPAAPATFTSFTIAGMGARDIASGTDGSLWIDGLRRRAHRQRHDGRRVYVPQHRRHSAGHRGRPGRSGALRQPERPAHDRPPDARCHSADAPTRRTAIHSARCSVPTARTGSRTSRPRRSAA